ncbi:hypothetical protein HF521_016959 [Silurus meridionalis]|uniref:Uncharacterized protein n=1 Tax=Silurus meridionalis TaxID=175797 RepID=A0A8T0BKV9_SILME|nr:hypothetical protein HF521_016959 [Silurus meridionalis]
MWAWLNNADVKRNPEIHRVSSPHGAHSAFYSTMHNTLHHHHVLHHGGVHPCAHPGPPKLATDIVVLSCLPEAMQRVYSIHFNRNRGKLQLKGIPSSVPPSLNRQHRSLDLGEQVNTELEQDPPSSVCSRFILIMMETSCLEETESSQETSCLEETESSKGTSCLEETESSQGTSCLEETESSQVTSCLEETESSQGTSCLEETES